MKQVMALILVLGALFGGLGSASAQMPGTGASGGEGAAAGTALPDPLTPEAVRGLVARLSDEEVRAMLLERLDAVASAPDAEEPLARSFLDYARDNIVATGASIGSAIINIPQIPGAVAGGVAKWWSDRGTTGVGLWAQLFAAAIAAGFGAHRLCAPIVRGWETQIRDAAPSGLRETVIVLAKRAILDFAWVVVFITAASIVISLTMSDADQKISFDLLLQPVLYCLVVASVNRFLLAPGRPELRLVHTSDATASFLYRQTIILAAIYGSIYFIVFFLIDHGMKLGESRLGFWLNLLFYGYLMWVVWTARDGLSEMMRGSGELTPGEEQVARAFPYFAMVITGVAWFTIELLIASKSVGFLQGQTEITLLLALAAPAFDTLVRGLVQHLAPPMVGVGPLAERAYAATRRAYVRIGRVAVFGVFLLTVLRIWEIDITNLAAGGVGAQAAARLVGVLGILATGYLVWEVVRLMINRKLAAEVTSGSDPADGESEPEAGGEGGGAGGSRLSTVLPLIGWALQAAIVVLTVLIALGNIGVDVTPLLAGAGIIGLAIGFGAQKLVADIVSGIFFLVDDAFRVGEYVSIDGTVGTVERISVRSLQLRHHRGAIHTIPFGEIPRITNYSRDWVIMKLKFTVPFGTDLGKVKKIFKQIGKDLEQVPELAKDMIQPFKSQGVLEVDDVGIVIRGKFMANPGKQFTLRKEIYQRVASAFAENGISFARREVHVKVDGGEDADEEDVRAAAGAAAAAAAQDAMPDPAR